MASTARAHPLHLVAERLLAASRADNTIAIVTSTSQVNTRWARNGLTTNGHSEVAEATVIAIAEGPDGQRAASASASAVGLDAADLAGEALAEAQRSGPAWDAAPLPEPLQAAPVTGIWSEPAASTSAAGLCGTLEALGAAIARDEREGREHFGYLQHTLTTTWLLTSTGVALRFDQPGAVLEMTVKSHDRTRSTWQGWAGLDPAAADPVAMAQRARTELAWQSRSIEVAPGRHRVLLSPSAVADLMIDLLYGADARAAADGRTAFSRPGGGTRIGEALTDQRVSLFSDPQLPGQSGAPFLVAGMSHDAASAFDNGLPLQRTSWISEGVLSALVCSRAVAEATGVPLALQPDTLAMDAAGTGSTADLVARTDNGLLLTCTWYNRMVDPQTHLITGLTRDGVYQVRDGEVVGAVQNFRFNESPVELLARIGDASAPVPALGREMADYFTRTTMPALLVEDFNLSSPSRAI